MIRGMYSVASALDAAATNQDLIAENLSNVNMPGYRRHGLQFETVQQDANNQAGVAADLAGTAASRSYTTFEGGPMEHTGNPLDLALSGKAFFVLEGPNGLVYTRNGSFARDAAGLLQSRSGMPVRGLGGRINVPETTREITVARDGTVYADKAEVGQLQLTEFDDPNALQRVGTTLFSGPGGHPPAPAASLVEQGYREGSNVQIVNEMVSMMSGMRYYEAAQRALRALGDAIAQNTRPQA